MPNTCWIATRKGLLKAQQADSQAWTLSPPDFVGDPVTMVLPDAGAGTMYAALNLGHFGPKLHRSTDSGQNWVECSAPAFPKKEKDKDEDDESAKSVEMIWILEHGKDGDLWAGTVPAGLFRSRDQGDSWEFLPSLTSMDACSEWFGGGFDEPGVHSICVDPRNPHHLTISISCGGVWDSTDEGSNWTSLAEGMRADYVPVEEARNPNIQDPHRVIACPSVPSRMWAQHHNGIFRYDENAASWTEIIDVAPSVFGFALAVHPSDPDTAWFVPAVKDDCRIPVDNKLVVNRTSDGGKSFSHLSQGLPQEHSYDLVYRHCLDIAADGETLMMGSTSGNLWVSTNAGDNWQQLSGNLADVYCVKFGL